MEDADNIEGPGQAELDPAVVDFLEFYLLNYFKPAGGGITQEVEEGRRLMEKIRCTACHVSDLTIARDRRVADVETVFRSRARSLEPVVHDSARLVHGDS